MRLKVFGEPYPMSPAPYSGAEGSNCARIDSRDLSAELTEYVGEIGTGGLAAPESFPDALDGQPSAEILVVCEFANQWLFHHLPP